MISFDVNSLFTKVPVDEALYVLAIYLPQFNLNLPIPNFTFINLVKLCTLDNVFSADDSFYRQKTGLMMGNNLSPILSSMFLEHLERTVFTKIPEAPKIWLRYVDDVFATVPDVGFNFDLYFERLNNAHPNIRFKTEWENENCLPFLDVQLNRGNGKIEFDVYRKPTNSSSYIHIYSFHDLSVKKSVLTGMFLRAYRYCDVDKLDHELNNVDKIFKDLKYPPWLLEQCHRKARQRYYVPDSTTKDDQYKSAIVLPFSTKLVELKPKIDSKCKITFEYNNLKKYLIKNHIPDTSATIYKIPCNNCEESYIGETGRDVITRVKEHRACVRRGDENNSCFRHMRDKGHAIDFDETKEIVQVKDHHKRKILESALIDKEDTFNISKGFYSFSPLINNLILKSYKDRLKYV